MDEHCDGDTQSQLLHWITRLDTEACRRRNSGRRATDGLFRIVDCVLVALPKLPFDGSAANDPIYNQERHAAFLFFVRFSAKLTAKTVAFCSIPFVLCQIAFTAFLRVKFLIVFSFFPLFPTSSQCQINCSPTLCP